MSIDGVSRYAAESVGKAMIPPPVTASYLAGEGWFLTPIGNVFAAVDGAHTPRPNVRRSKIPRSDVTTIIGRMNDDSLFSTTGNGLPPHGVAGSVGLSGYRPARAK